MIRPHRILVIKLADIGDAVLALPAVQALRVHAPEARIDVLTTPAGASVFRLNPAVDEVIEFAKHQFDRLPRLSSRSALVAVGNLALQLRRRRYDWTVLLHHLTTSMGALKHRALVSAAGSPVVAGLDNGRGSFLTHRADDFGFGALTEWEYGLEIVRSLGVPANPTQPILDVPESARERVSSTWGSMQPDTSRVLIHAEVGEFSPARAWAIERFIEVARRLVDDGSAQVAFVGTTPRAEIANAASACEQILDLVGETTFPELCALVENSNLVIGADSAVTHLAGAFERPALALFGPSNARAWKPIGTTLINAAEDSEIPSTSIALSMGLPCSPCIYTGFGLGRPEGCPLRTCMSTIDADAVMRIAAQILQRAPNNV
jgi:ADP-heptose:LPS heptosyltransferase